MMYVRVYTASYQVFESIPGCVWVLIKINAQQMFRYLYMEKRKVGLMASERNSEIRQGHGYISPLTVPPFLSPHPSCWHGRKWTEI